MDKVRFYNSLSLASISFGLGVLSGDQLTNGTSSTPTWIGLLLILAGAVVLGMSIASRSAAKPAPKVQKDSKKEPQA